MSLNEELIRLLSPTQLLEKLRLYMLDTGGSVAEQRERLKEYLVSSEQSC
jgi:hypothetical protein